MSLPLNGLKILDFSTLLPGPYATQLLSDMGAEVLRIESPTRPDLLKMMPPMVGKVSAAHATINRNKKSLALDLKKPQAKDIIKKLLSEYDIVVEQFRPGVMSRLGLGYSEVKAINPSVIYCSITGYGQTGPLKDRAGHDINYLALSGLASYSGTKESGPMLSATQIADIAGGSHHAVMAILAAYIQRTTNGEGQHLDISMSDAALSLNTMFGAAALADAKPPGLGTEMLNGGLFYGYYQTADDKYLSIGSLEPNFAAGLLSLLGLQDCMNLIADVRPASQEKLKKAIQDKISAQSRTYWVEAFAAIDVCVEPVLDFNEAAQHPHFVERGMVVQALDEHGNSVQQLKSALPFPATQVTMGAELGRHTQEVMQSLGYSNAEIEELAKQACVKTYAQ
jgi:crotonobetainyl-CoA:carnitine CoA-transferase CaiB-like acyl-CoA transferase